MARLQSRASVAQPSHSARTKIHKTKKHKVIFENVIQERKKLLTVISFHVQAPDGYTFVLAGNPKMNNLCKELSREEGAKIYVVTVWPELEKRGFTTNTPPANTTPNHIVDQACMGLGLHIDKDGQVHRRTESDANRNIHYGPFVREDTAKSENQKTLYHNAREAIKDLFPNIPKQDLDQIVKQAFKKGKHKVGTASELPLVRRVQLAVVAHIRHVYTDYDKLLKKCSFHEARSRVEKPCLDQLVRWRGDDENGTIVLEDILREVIVISDDEDSDDDEETLHAENHRESSFEIISSHDLGRDVVTRPIDFSQRNNMYHDDSPEIFDDGHMQANFRQVRREPPRSRHVEGTTEDHRGFSRYRAWEQALDRYRQHPDASGPSRVPIPPREPVHVLEGHLAPCIVSQQPSYTQPPSPRPIRPAQHLNVPRSQKGFSGLQPIDDYEGRYYVQHANAGRPADDQPRLLRQVAPTSRPLQPEPTYNLSPVTRPRLCQPNETGPRRANNERTRPENNVIYQSIERDDTNIQNKAIQNSLSTDEVNVNTDERQYRPEENSRIRKAHEWSPSRSEFLDPHDGHGPRMVKRRRLLADDLPHRTGFEQTCHYASPQLYTDPGNPIGVREHRRRAEPSALPPASRAYFPLTHSRVQSSMPLDLPTQGIQSLRIEDSPRMLPQRLTAAPEFINAKPVTRIPAGGMPKERFVVSGPPPSDRERPLYVVPSTRTFDIASDVTSHPFIRVPARPDERSSRQSVRPDAFHFDTGPAFRGPSHNYSSHQVYGKPIQASSNFSPLSPHSQQENHGGRSEFRNDSVVPSQRRIANTSMHQSYYIRENTIPLGGGPEIIQSNGHSFPVETTACSGHRRPVHPENTLSIRQVSTSGPQRAYEPGYGNSRELEPIGRQSRPEFRSLQSENTTDQPRGLAAGRRFIDEDWAQVASLQPRVAYDRRSIAPMHRRQISDNVIIVD
ncbi:MAG: hypothetical protein M1834_009115 [Cirrosporium novae-zelandiae]|nr:MAG: hypothetical protein M1834_009115 [Cirrosporium novae-zelandiae]